jgi:CelD/BcsL family acetyltransferase involved in cellulose biosynthesis
VQRDFASYHFRICSQQELTETLIRDIVSLSNARIAAKDQVSLHDEEKTKQLIKLVQLHGFVGLITIDGRVCAGAICSKLGANYFLHVLAHDPLYDRYSLGTLCCYLTICESIARAGQTFHFLWGRMDYKYRLQGVQCDLQRVVVYRSRQQFFLNAAHALKITFKGLAGKGLASGPRAQKLVCPEDYCQAGIRHPSYFWEVVVWVTSLG